MTDVLIQCTLFTCLAADMWGPGSACVRGDGSPGVGGPLLGGGRKLPLTDAMLAVSAGFPGAEPGLGFPGTQEGKEGGWAGRGKGQQGDLCQVSGRGSSPKTGLA